MDNKYTSEILIFIIFVIGVIGWIWNLIKVIQMFSCPLSVESLMRVISIIFWPLGMILGYFPVGGC